jgi:hypothetical protein
MYILGIRADKVDKDLILRLIENQVQESKSLDYKRDLKFSKDQDKKEFLFDITAMYNTDGGCFVFGIEELKDENGQNTGKPYEITGIDIGNFDKLSQQIEDIVKNSSEPSVTQLILNEIDIDNKKILIIGVPKGLGLPAMVTYNQTNKFYKRRNSGKFPVDVYELNQMFMQNQVLAEKANDFRNNRIDKVLKKEFLPNLKIETSYFIHIIPYSFLDSKFINLSLAKEKFKKEMKPLNAYGWDNMFNIDGYASFSTTSDRTEISSYNQLFRNGIYEAYSSEMFYETRHQNKLGFDGKHLIEETLNIIKNGLFILNEMEVEPPFLISFSFHNVLGKILDNDRSYYSKAFSQNKIVFPLIQIDNYDIDVYERLKPNFDVLYQALGFEESPKIE